MKKNSSKILVRVDKNYYLSEKTEDQRMIHFNGMSTHAELFYSKRLENHEHCMIIYICYVYLIVKISFLVLIAYQLSWVT